MGPLRTPNVGQMYQKKGQQTFSNYFELFQGQSGQEVMFLNCESGLNSKVKCVEDP